MSAPPACRACGSPLRQVFCDLGASPLANSYLAPAALWEMEPFYPLAALVCAECLLVQVPAMATPEAIFGDYAYFSSYSESWLAHARAYVEAMIARFGLGPEHAVMEIASNDGYLLQYFQGRGIPVLGIEPARNVAAAAIARGIPTRVEFFGTALARRLAAEGRRADLLLGNNVLAHVPDLADFVAGLGLVLKPGGVLTLEFPHLLRLIDENQFDTIYHEHFSYFSLHTARRVCAAQGLAVFDVEELPSHGGSLRIYAAHAGEQRPACARLAALAAREEAAGLTGLAAHLRFGERVKATKRRLLAFLLEVKAAGGRIAGYGAPAKGNTLLNYCGVGTDFVDFTVDRNPEKQGKFLPGTRIPIHAPERLLAERPDFVWILPWNLKDEVMVQMAAVRSWGGKFFVAIPEVRIYE